MRNRLLPLLAIFLFAGSQRADAQSTSLDLDTAPGNFSTWKVSGLMTSTVIFDVTYVETKKDEKWLPTYAIKIGDSGGQLFVFSGAYQGSDVPQTKAHLWKDKKDISSSGSSSDSILAFTLKQTYKVQLAWIDGKVTATINGNSKEYAVPFKPSEIQISCSTGELEVKNIVFQ